MSSFVRAWVFRPFALVDKKRELLPDESDDVDKLGGGDST